MPQKIPLGASGVAYVGGLAALTAYALDEWLDVRKWKRVAYDVRSRDGGSHAPVSLSISARTRPPPIGGMGGSGGVGGVGGSITQSCQPPRTSDESDLHSMNWPPVEAGTTRPRSPSAEQQCFRPLTVSVSWSQPARHSTWKYGACRVTSCVAMMSQDSSLP